MEEVLKELMGDSFKEGLTKEEISSFFEDSISKSGKYVPIDKFTAVEKKAKKVDSLQQEVDTYKNAQLTEQQRLEQALEANVQSMKEMQRRLCKSNVEKVLTAGGMNEDDYKDIIDSLVLEDEEQSTKLAQNLVSTFSKKVEAEVQAKMAAELAKAGAKPAGAGAETITKEAFDKMSYSQMMKLAEENPTLYASLTK